jgi:hypothetical protein
MRILTGIIGAGLVLWALRPKEVIMVTPDSIHQLLRTKYPGMEHYFLSGDRGSSGTGMPREGVSYGFHPDRWIKGQKVPHPHKAHTSFIYCGFVDCLSHPFQGRVWRSTSLAGLNRLILADDPDYIPETKAKNRIGESGGEGKP